MPVQSPARAVPAFRAEERELMLYVLEANSSHQVAVNCEAPYVVTTDSPRNGDVVVHRLESAYRQKFCLCPSPYSEQDSESTEDEFESHYWKQSGGTAYLNLNSDGKCIRILSSPEWYPYCWEREDITEKLWLMALEGSRIYNYPCRIQEIYPPESFIARMEWDEPDTITARYSERSLWTVDSVECRSQRILSDRDMAAFSDLSEAERQAYYQHVRDGLSDYHQSQSTVIFRNGRPFIVSLDPENRRFDMCDLTQKVRQEFGEDIPLKIPESWSPNPFEPEKPSPIVDGIDYTFSSSDRERVSEIHYITTDCYQIQTWFYIVVYQSKASCSETPSRYGVLYQYR